MSAGKKFATIENHETNRRATCHYSSEWGEFTVRFFKGTEHQAGADYMTDDRVDALNTATHWSNEHDH